MHDQVPVRSTAITRFQFSIVPSAVSLPCSPSMPAELNAASRRPYVATACATASATVVVVGDVARNERACTPGAQLRLSLGAGLRVDVCQRHGVPPPNECLCRCPPDARTCTGDKDNLLILRRRHCSSFLGCRRTSGRAAGQLQMRSDRSVTQPVDDHHSVADHDAQRFFGSRQQRRVVDGVSVDDDEICQRAGFDHPDPGWRIHQQLTGIRRTPAEYVCRLRGRRSGCSRRIRGRSCRPGGPAGRPP